MMQPSPALVFDVGKVIIEWDVHALFRPHLGSDTAVDTFLDETSFMAWNATLDGGKTLEHGIGEMVHKHPAYTALFEAFARDWIQTVPGQIDGTVAILDELKAKGIPLYAITNFSAQTWPCACAKFPVLANSFIDVVVSGQEKLLKPDAAIFELLARRNGLNLRDCIFIDDSPSNIIGARATGMQAIQFTGPSALRVALKHYGFL